MGTTPDLLTWVAVLVPLLAGMLFVRLGLRGKRVDDHPLCRRCGFDLFGLPEGATKCSECGADLSVRWKAVRIGNRHRRGGLAAVGALLLIFGMGGFTLVTTVSWTGTDVNAWKPVWLLARELGSDDVAQREFAIKELGARMTAATLTAKDAGVVTDRILAWQTDPARTWVKAWGETMFQMRWAGLVPDEKWHAFALNAFDVKLKARPILRRGDALPYEVTVTPGRGAEQTDLQPAWEIIGYSIGGQPASAERNRYDAREGHPIARPLSELRMTREKLAAVPDGPTVVDVRVRLELHYNGPPYGLAAERTVLLTSPVQLESADGEGLELLTDAATRAAVKSSFGVHRHISLGLSDSWDVLVRDGCAHATLVARDLPVDVAYNVRLLWGGGEYDMGTVVARANKQTQYKNVQCRVDERTQTDATTATILIRSNPAAARQTLDVVAIGDVEIAFRDLRVRLAPPVNPRERRRGFSPYR